MVWRRQGSGRNKNRKSQRSGAVYFVASIQYSLQARAAAAPRLMLARAAAAPRLMLARRYQRAQAEGKRSTDAPKRRR